MADKELLELAAKAAGIEMEWSDFGNAGRYWVRKGTATHWRPLTDDGDALRLAVKLKLIVATDFAGAVNVGVVTKSLSQEEFNNDPYAATRRAIVRAAAEIGKERSDE